MAQKNPQYMKTGANMRDAGGNTATGPNKKGSAQSSTGEMSGVKSAASGSSKTDGSTLQGSGPMRVLGDKDAPVCGQQATPKAKPPVS